MTTRILNAILAACLVLFLFCSYAYAGAAASKAYKVFDSNYSAPAITADWIGIANASEPNFAGLGTENPYLKSDDGYAEVQLPFEVNFFDDDYASVYIMADGALSFAQPIVKGAKGVPFPAENLSSAIAPFWTDLTPRNDLGFGNGTIRYSIIGASPYRTFVVEWFGISHYDHSGDRYNFQVQMFEDSGDIVFLYRNMVGINASGIGATIGLNSFPGEGFVQYANNALPVALPVSSSVIFKVAFIRDNNEWVPFENKQIFNESSITDKYPTVTISDTKNATFFTGTLSKADMTCEIKYFDGSTFTVLPSIASRITSGWYSNQGYSYGLEDLQLVNAGGGSVYAFLLVSLTKGSEKIDGAPGFTFGQTVFAGLWDGTDWLDVGTASLSKGIYPAEYNFIHSFSVCWNLVSNYPAIAYSWKDPDIAGALLQIYFSQYSATGWLMSVLSSKASGKIDAAPGDVNKILPSLQISNTGVIWIAFQESVEGTGGFIRVVHKSDTSSWEDATVGLAQFNEPALEFISIPKIYVKDNSVVVGFYSNPGTPTAEILYCADASTYSFTNIPCPSVPAPFGGETAQIPVDVMLNFEGKPVFLYNGASPSLRSSLNAWIYDGVWNPLALRSEFDGLSANLNGVYACAMVPDAVENPSVIFSAWDGTGSSNIFLQHFVINVFIETEDDRDSLSVFHGPSEESSTSTIYIYSSYSKKVSGVVSSDPLGKIFGGLLSGNVTSDGSFSLSFDSSNLNAGVYFDQVDFAFGGVYNQPSLSVRFVKTKHETVRTVPMEFSSVAYALAASSPGDTVYLLNGTYDFTGIVIPPAVTITGKSIDGVIITGNLEFLSTSFTFNTVTFDVTSANMSLHGDNFPAICKFKNVLFKLGANDLDIENAVVDFDFCTIVANKDTSNKTDQSGTVVGGFGSIVCKFATIAMRECIVSVERFSSFPDLSEFEYCYSGQTVLNGYFDISNAVSATGYGFVDEANGDLHLASQAGHYHYASGTFILDAPSATSPLIDAADPLLSVLFELQPHRYRANLGAYGQTSWASKSPTPDSSYHMVLKVGTQVTDYRMRCIPLMPKGSEEAVLDVVNHFKYDATQMRVFAFDPSTGKYVEMGSGVPISWYPGRGFWIISSATTSLDFNGTLPADDVSIIDLKAGWNMVGLPNLAPLDVSKLMVLKPNGGLVNIYSQTAGLESVATDIYEYSYLTHSYNNISSVPIAAGSSVWIFAFHDTKLYYNASNNKVDAATKEPYFKSAPTAPPAPPSLVTGDVDSSSSSAGGCFIATAAFGSLSASAVSALTSFRDSVAFSSRSTSSLVSLYYSVSPEIASDIRYSHSVLAILRRFLD